MEGKRASFPLPPSLKKKKEKSKPWHTRNSLCESASKSQRMCALRVVLLQCVIVSSSMTIYGMFTEWTDTYSRPELAFKELGSSASIPKSDLARDASSSNVSWLTGTEAQWLHLTALPVCVCTHFLLRPHPASRFPPCRLSTLQSHRGINAHSRMLLLNGAYVTCQGHRQAHHRLLEKQLAKLRPRPASHTGSSPPQSILFTSNVQPRSKARHWGGGAGGDTLKMC